MQPHQAALENVTALVAFTLFQIHNMDWESPIEQFQQKMKNNMTKANAAQFPK